MKDHSRHHHSVNRSLGSFLKCPLASLRLRLVLKRDAINHLFLSLHQLEECRSLCSHEKYETEDDTAGDSSEELVAENFRKPQPLCQRDVYFYG